MGRKKGFKLTEETKEKMRKPKSRQHRMNISKAVIKLIKEGKGNPFKKGNKIRNTGRTRFKKGYKQSKEHIRKRLKRNPKSSLEIKFEKIINKLNLPYRFVGNGEFFIERKCPDFINTNGEKIAIEVYYRDHKNKFKNKTLLEWKEERQEIFNKYGWKIEFFDEIQVNHSEVIRRLRGDTFGY